MSSLKITDFQAKINLPEVEHDVIKYWEQTKAFEQSTKQRPQEKPYIFYDGPPFATGTPHYGHILASTIKDVIPRFKTMQGYRVERVWGWDCHGLPIENIVEKQLGLKGGKKAIKELGIDKFNAACRAAIFKFDKEWERVIRRIGRWVDFKNSYKTMDLSYMESVWWAFKQLYDKDLTYQGKKVVLYCPRCATPLSNFEIAMDNSYKDLEVPSTVYKYELKDEPGTFLLAWSTTPWNKLATPALAVNPNLDYVKVKQGKDSYILAKDTLGMLTDKPAHKIIDTFKGSTLAGTQFTLHYDFYPDRDGKKAGVVVTDDYVTAQEGTGIVTLAVYGEDDFRVMTRENIQLVEHVDDQGVLKPEVTPFSGQFMLKVNPLVNQDLSRRGLIYSDQPKTSSVPVCYRCETRLYHAPVPAWFINITKLKPALIKHNQDINWYPPHLKDGRFGKGLESAPDWNISRSRFWGTPMPIWVGESGKIRVIGSLKDLKQWAVDPSQVEKITDIHREFIDDLQVWVDNDKKEKGRRIPEVFDCWVESGSMPYASVHYPFEHKAKFDSSYPAQFIAEYIAQTRAWFYTLHVMSVGIFDEPSFQNAVTTGNILSEDGAKMSKSKKNFPDPEPFIEQYGADALRFYLMNSSVMKADNTNFSEESVKDIYRGTINILYNTFTFYRLYAPSQTPPDQPPQADHILDHWLLSQTNSLVQSVTNSLEDYDTPTATRLLKAFVTDLSTWYLRRSRDRLKTDESAQAIFAWSLNQLIHLLAPFTPFITELIHQNLSNSDQSIHLNPWPQADTSQHDQSLNTSMDLVRKISSLGHAQRKEHQISLRQPLSSLTYQAKTKLEPPFLELIQDELNVKAVSHQASKSDQDLQVTLDTQLNQELKDEGRARDIIRQVQSQRKKALVKLDQKITLTLPDWPEALTDQIKQKTLASSISKGDKLSIRPTN